MFTSILLIVPQGQEEFWRELIMKMLLDPAAATHFEDQSRISVFAKTMATTGYRYAHEIGEKLKELPWETANTDNLLVLHLGEALVNLVENSHMARWIQAITKVADGSIRRCWGQLLWGATVPLQAKTLSFNQHPWKDFDHDTDDRNHATQLLIHAVIEALHNGPGSN